MKTDLYIQRKRISGYKMPEGAVYVGRGTAWGNPFKLMAGMIYVDARYRRKILNKWVIFDEVGTIEKVISLYKLVVTGTLYISEPVSPYRYDEIINNPDVTYWRNQFAQLNLDQLKGKKLSCWCNKNEPCHAKVLIELANK